MIPALIALVRGWADLLQPRILGTLGLGVGLTLLLFVALQAGVFWAIRLIAPDTLSLPWIGAVPVGTSLSWGSLVLFPVMGFFLMAPVAAAFAGLFTERVADTVEDLHYPDRHGVPADFLDGVLESLVVTGLVLGVGLGLLIVTPFVGPLGPVLFYVANGWLLGREFFRMAARRHLSADQADALRRRRGGTVTLLGIGIAALLTVPVVNIVVPVLAAASFTHLFHQISGSASPAPARPRG